MDRSIPLRCWQGVRRLRSAGLDSSSSRGAGLTGLAHDWSGNDRLRPASAGLGVRRPQMEQLLADLDAVDFVEAAPENWLDVGGRYGRLFSEICARKPLICHGLSLSLGGPDKLDEGHVHAVRDFLQRHRAALYSEHLSACTDGAHMYDLMPLPLTERMVVHISDRISRVQDICGQQIAVENSSYYLPLASEMSEADFVRAVVARADCRLLLDVNNVYVNSVNHGYDPHAFIRAMPSERIAYLHIAGHAQETPTLIVDTHGAPVVDRVWDLLDFTYAVHGVRPTLLERDFDFPPMAELLRELARVRDAQQRAGGSGAIAASRLASTAAHA